MGIWGWGISGKHLPPWGLQDPWSMVGAVLDFWLTFRRRFYISRNSMTFQVDIKHLGTFRPDLCTEFR